MRIDVSELLENVGSTLELRVSERVTYPEDGLLIREPVRSVVKLTNAGGPILLQGGVTATIELECGRCLNHFDHSVESELAEVFGRESSISKGRGKEAEVEEDDFVFPVESDNTVDVGEVIRQNMILDLPMKPVCVTDCSNLEKEK